MLDDKADDVVVVTESNGYRDVTDVVTVVQSVTAPAGNTVSLSGDTVTPFVDIVIVETIAMDVEAAVSIAVDTTESHVVVTIVMDTVVAAQTVAVLANDEGDAEKPSTSRIMSSTLAKSAWRSLTRSSAVIACV